MLKYLAGPLIGAVIGYFTNYIAVKMLFYPRKEIYFLGHRLPFTPGAIPKGKSRLAKAIGAAVGSTLVTREDLEEKLLSDTVQDQLADTLMQALETPLKSELMALTGCDEEVYEDKKTVLSGQISQAAIRCTEKIDLAAVFVEKGGAVIKERVAGTMLAMFLSDELIASIAGPVGMEMQRMLQEEGVDALTPLVKDELSGLEEKTAVGLLEQMQISEEMIRKTLKKICTDVIRKEMSSVFETLDLGSIAREKVEQMSVEELEDLVLTIMRKELNMIVNLGALIGLVLGTLNIWL